MMKKVVLVTAILLLASVVVAQDMVPLPKFGRTYTGNTRGFYFQAPIEFFVVGLRVPDETNKLVQQVALMKSLVAPPAYPGTTLLTPVFADRTGKPSANIIPCKAKFAAKEWVVAIGCCNGSNSYAATSGAFASNVLGNPVSLTRGGVQQNITTVAPPYAIWSEAAGTVSRVEVYVADAHLMGDKAKPKPGETVSFLLEGVSADKGKIFVMASSLGAGPTVIAKRNVWLAVDNLFLLSLGGGALPTVFSGYTGAFNTSSMAKAKLVLPNVGALTGIKVNTAFAVTDNTAPSGFSAFSNPFMFQIG